MIAELNKIYIISAPKAVASMADEPDHFVVSTSTDQTYVEMNNLRSASAKEQTITSVAKVFSYKGNTLQAVIYVTNLPMRVCQQRLNKTVQQYAKNIADQQTNRRVAREE